MSQLYVGELPVSISYQNLPKDKAPLNTLVTEGHARVEATGFRLLFARFLWGAVGLDVDYSRYGDASPYILSRDIVQSSSDGLPKGFKLVHLEPDTLHFVFQSVSTKKLPVRLRSEINPAKQFSMMGPAKLTPDSVTVTGPESIMDTLQSWPTEMLVLNGINTTVTDTLGIFNNSSNFEVSPDHIRYEVPIEAYTEASVNVPIKSINLNSNEEVSLYPDSVTVTFLVGLSKHHAIEASQFQVVADFKDVSLSDDKYITLQMTRLPAYIKNPTVSPLSVEYILYK